ncbi:MAG: ABC transporter substrate-binding protein [Desulfobacterales bacterium]|jgi:peptide/nickel transport system substrate-binding protein|nr:ABC transporter substrate-binding protein [Desulfobacterales bacterium]
MKEFKCFVLAMLAVALLLGAGQPAAAEKVLNIGVFSADMGIIDPHRSATTANLPIMDSIFNGLVRWKPGSVDLELIEPDLAERWESTPDGKVWTFHLRKGVQFHHGFGEMTAEDVVFSLKKAANKETSIWFTGYTAFEKVEAVDPYTVRITLANNVPSMLGLVLNFHGGMVLSKKAVEKYGDDFKLNPVGTGPFAFKEYIPKQKTILVAHPQYFRGKPKIDRVVYHFVPVDQAREMAFLKGELDMIEGVKQEWWVEKMKKEKNVSVDALPPGELTMVHFNMTKKPLDDVRVRRALAHAINRGEFRESYGLSITGDAVSVIGPGYLGFTDKVAKYEFSPDKAKALLKEAGFPNGFHLGEFVTSPIYLNSAELLQGQLQKIGVGFEIKMVDHPTMHKMIRQDLNALVPYGAARFPIADEMMTQFFHSNSIVGTPTGITNFSHYGKAAPGVDDLLDQARVEPNVEKQKALWVKAQQKVMEDLPAYPLRITYVLFARKNNIDLGYDLKSNMTLHYQLTEKTDIK